MDDRMSSSCHARSPTPSTLAMHKISSHAIAKVKRKTRIVHILEPEIIKIEEVNFREIVQSLTGIPNKNKKVVEAVGEGEVRMMKKEKKVIGEDDGKCIGESCEALFDGVFLQGFFDELERFLMCDS